MLEVLVQEKYTKPPQHFTEDTLLKAMEKAGSEALEKDIEVERYGLGTPATRAGIIENLIFKGFIKRDKKKLIATHKGVALVAIVADEFKSPATTSIWEMKLSGISEGKIKKEEFIKEIQESIERIVDMY